jgi:hypothetical protein
MTAVSDEVRALVIETADSLHGAERRRFQARTLDRLRLGQRQAADLFHWGRDTLRKAVHERYSGITCCDAFCARGRKPIEATRLPQLLADLRAVVAEHVQTDPTFQSTRLYCRLTAAEVRRQLIDRKGYTDAQLPTIKTITTKLNALGFQLTKVAKCRPQKKYQKPTPSSSG